ncbi:MAG: hypothetical protein N2510_03615 [Ignavibacteria bacterium]|nr:hypothetical protein [Ignavibacteria bacterium]
MLKEEQSNKILLCFFWLLLGVILSVWIYNSDGFYFIDDSSHYNYNRHYLESYDKSTGAWHRMGRVLLFAIPAQFGLKGVQITSAFIFILTIYFTYKILKLHKLKNAEWIIPVTGFQPVLFNISYTSLAELPAAFLIVLSYYLFLKNKPVSVMIVSSLIFIFRTEYFYVACIYFLIYAFRKNYRVLPLVTTGPLLWYFYTTLITMNPLQFFHDMTLHSRLPRIEGGIDWYYYIFRAPKIYGILQVFFFLTALIVIFLRNEIKTYALPLFFFFTGILIQTLFALKGLELTCSIGQLRYVAVVGPMLGIVSAAGMDYLYEKIKNTVLRYIMALMFLLIMFILGPYATPFHNKFEIEKVCDEIREFVKERYPDYIILSNLHQLANSLDEPQTGGKTFRPLTQKNLETYEKAIIVWSHYLEGSPFVEENVLLKELESMPSVELVREYNYDGINNCLSIPLYKYRKEGEEYKCSREFIDYMIADQTSWEEINIKVFRKN